MFHTCATFVAATATVNMDQPAIADNIMTIANTHFLPRQDMFLWWAYHSGVTQLRARITSPKIRQVSPSFIRPINAALLPATLTRPMNLTRTPLRLAGQEEFAVEGTNSAAGPNNSYTVLGISLGPVPPTPIGDVYSMRGTGTGTAVASAWTQVTMTWADTLPAGRWQVVGMNAWSATAIAARVIFDQQVWRPGCVAGATDVVIQDEMFRNGNLGPWGEFNAYSPPNIEFLCNAADTAFNVYLDIMRIG